MPPSSFLTSSTVIENLSLDRDGVSASYVDGDGGGGGVVFFSCVRILEECSTIYSPPALFFKKWKLDRAY